MFFAVNNLQLTKALPFMQLLKASEVCCNGHIHAMRVSDRQHSILIFVCLFRWRTMCDSLLFSNLFWLQFADGFLRPFCLCGVSLFYVIWKFTHFFWTSQCNSVDVWHTMPDEMLQHNKEDRFFDVKTARWTKSNSLCFIVTYSVRVVPDRQRERERKKRTNSTHKLNVRFHSDGNLNNP